MTLAAKPLCLQNGIFNAWDTETRKHCHSFRLSIFKIGDLLALILH